jgi:hypothetical protein
MGLEGLRRGAQSLINNRRSRGTGRKANWHLGWKPPMREPGARQSSAQPVVIVDASYPDLKNPGETTPFFGYQQHNYKLAGNQFRSFTCSGDPCIGCFDYSHGKKWAAPRDMAAFNLLHLAWYHEIPLTDNRTGQIIYKDNKPGEMVMVMEECEATQTNPTCRYCAQNMRKQFGLQRYFAMGTGYLETILGIDKKLGSQCVRCGTNVVTQMYHCAACGAALYDTASGFFNDQQLAQYVDSPTECHACHATDKPQPRPQCGYDPTGRKLVGRGCPEGAPQLLTIFDVVIYLERESGDIAKLVDVATVPFSQFPTPDGRPLEQIRDELCKEPFNFDQHFAPESVEEQAKRLGIPNPFLTQAPPQYQNYQPPPVQGQPPAWQQPGQQPPPPQPNYGVPVPPGPPPGPGVPQPPGYGVPVPPRPPYGNR